jgi:hypothetical protein
MANCAIPRYVATATSSVTTRRTAATSKVDYLVANSATSSDIPRMNTTATSRLKTRETSPISHRTPFQRVATSRGLRYLILDFFLDSGETQNITSQKLILQNFRVFQPGLRQIGGSGRMKVDFFGVGEIDVLDSVNGILKSQIRDVLYAPSIGNNKISVGAITNKGTDIHFAGSQALIVRKDIIEVTAKRVGKSLFLLNISIVTADVASVARSAKNSLQEWHQCLAHRLPDHHQDGRKWSGRRPPLKARS